MLLARIINPALNSKVGNTTIQGDGPGILQLFLRNFIDIALGTAGVIFFFMLLRGGYEYLTAGGDKEAVQKATKRLTTSFIGIAIIFSLFALVFIVEALFGISLLQINIPTI